MKDDSKFDITLERIFYRIGIFSAILLIAGTSLEMKSAAKKATAEEVLQKGREAFLNYEFEEAEEFYDQYRTLKKKAKQETGEEFEIWENELSIASNAFERVQKIVVIDSISVPANKFQEAYRLASSAGRIGTPSVFNLPNNIKNQGLAFLSEDGDYIVYSQGNAEGDLRLFESRELLDGSWETQETLIGDFEKTGDYAYPFMSGDGQTLYFANNGEDSMGGFDLFVAQKDPFTGEFLQPLNLGMPFNSPYDDFMMAIDEENGIGWWATNRNDFEDKVTIFVYLIDEMRKNYPSDEENLAEYAKISNYKSTWESGKENKYKEILNKIK